MSPHTPAHSPHTQVAHQCAGGTPPTGGGVPHRALMDAQTVRPLTKRPHTQDRIDDPPHTQDTPPLPWIGFDYSHPSGVGACCRHIAELLSDGEWRHWAELVDEVQRNHHQLKRSTINNLIRGMVRTGGLELTGTYNRRSRRDSRRVRRGA